MAANKALINYYAKLVHRNDLTMEQVPPEFQKEVQTALEALPPLKRESEDPISDNADEAFAEDDHSDNDTILP